MDDGENSSCEQDITPAAGNKIGKIALLDVEDGLDSHFMAYICAQTINSWFLSCGNTIYVCIHKS